MSNSVFLKPDENGNWGKVGTDAAGSMSEQLVFQSGAAAVGNGTAHEVGGYAVLTIQTTITATATVAFEASQDGILWVQILSTVPLGGTGASQNTTSSTSVLRFAVSSVKYFRARVSSHTSGTVDVIGYASTSGFSPQMVTGTFGNSDSNSATTVLTASGAYNLLFDGTNWVRQRAISATDNVTVGLAANAQYVYDSPSLQWNRARSANGAADGSTGTNIGAQSLMAYNGTSWDRVRVDSNTNVKVANTAQNKSTSVTIATSGTISGAITLNGNNLVGLLIPSTWDGGNITIMGCDTVGGTYVDIYDSNGNIATVTVGGVSRIVGLTGSIMQAVANVPFIQLKSASAVAATRSIVVLAKG